MGMSADAVTTIDKNINAATAQVSKRTITTPTIVNPKSMPQLLSNQAVMVKYLIRSSSNSKAIT